MIHTLRATAKKAFRWFYGIDGKEDTALRNKVDLRSEAREQQREEAIQREGDLLEKAQGLASEPRRRSMSEAEWFAAIGLDPKKKRSEQSSGKALWVEGSKNHDD